MTEIECPKCQSSFDSVDIPAKLICLKEPFRMLYKCLDCKELLYTVFTIEQEVR
jgi:DNA-directed RNA polymerase subunit RPC12/RpoP